MSLNPRRAGLAHDFAPLLNLALDEARKLAGRRRLARKEAHIHQFLLALGCRDVARELAKRTAHDPQEALRIIRSLSGKRLDPHAVTSICAIYDRGEIRVTSAVDSVAGSVEAPEVAVALAVAGEVAASS